MLYQDEEFARLSSTYGIPEIRHVVIPGDAYLYSSRTYRSQTRRGEVVMAIERPGRKILLHRKGWYEAGVFRLPTGGIELEDRVDDTLKRELFEETGLRIVSARFLGLLDCEIIYETTVVQFISYIFHLPKTEGVLRLPEKEDIVEFRTIPIADLAKTAQDLRAIPAPRNGWGRWRAVAHEFVYDKLRQP